MKTFKFVMWIAAIVLAGTAGMGVWFYHYATTPVGETDAPVSVWIQPGEGFFQAMDTLQEAGLVRHREKFRWLAYLKGYETRIRAGEYALSASLSPIDILETLVRGDTVLHKVVIPEGATIRQIGEIVEKAALVAKQAFVETALSRRLADEFGIEGDTLEGYLFPETYHFPKGVTPEKMIQKMVDQFQSVFGLEWIDRAKDLGFSVHEVVTLASIVEKETASPAERPLIAAVFLNRLKKKMRLESDPTVIYGMAHFDGNITRKDLGTVTPYNTYRIKGLPPGPISNPGKASLQAVLYPTEVPYLYFVSKNDGTHHFSSSFSEHNRMVRKYQMRH